MESSHQCWWVSAAVYNCWSTVKFPSHEGQSAYSSVRSCCFFIWKRKPLPHKSCRLPQTCDKIWALFSNLYIKRVGIDYLDPLNIPGPDRKKLGPDLSFYRVKLILLQPVNVSKRKCNAKRIMIIIWTEYIWKSSLRMVPPCTLLPAEFSRSSNARWFKGFEEWHLAERWRAQGQCLDVYLPISHGFLSVAEYEDT